VFPELLIVGSECFYGCWSLKELIAPKCTEIRDAAFSETAIQTLKMDLINICEYAL
jgi:hypothetical protein